MKSLIVSLLLAVPAAVYSQDQGAVPGVDEMKAEAAESGPVQRPDAKAIMSDISAALRLSSKQNDRISSAVNKKTDEFDSLMKDYEKYAAEEKKWRYKMNEAHYKLAKINRDMPDTVREFLDDEQRQNFDSMLEAKRKPAEKPAAELAQPAPAADGAAQPARKKRLVRRKKLPAGAAGAAAPAAAAPAAEDEAGQVMVDKEPGAAAAPQGAPRKRRVLRRKAPAAPAGEAPAADIMANEPAGAKPTGKEAAPADDEAGSYP